MFVKKLELSVVFTQGLIIPSGDFHCNGNTELNERMDCILGLLCCVKIKGLLYLLGFRGGCLYRGADAAVIGQVVLFCHSDVLCMKFLIAAMVTFLHGRGKLFGSWHLDYFLGHW